MCLDQKPTITTEDLKLWLEWAGSKLLAMHIRSPYPQEYRSYWPDYILDVNEAFGYNKAKMTAPLPSAKDIQLMDEILSLPSVLSDPSSRRLLHQRALVTPVSNRYVNSWVKLAKIYHTDRRKVMRLHTKALEDLLKSVEKKKVYRLAQLFHSINL